MGVILTQGGTKIQSRFVSRQPPLRRRWCLCHKPDRGAIRRNGSVNRFVAFLSRSRLSDYGRLSSTARQDRTHISEGTPVRLPTEFSLTNCYYTIHVQKRFLVPGLAHRLLS